jgi:hypothetical protein
MIVPAAPSSISSTRRRISARINASPISAEPIISARRCAASKGRAVAPCSPARARVIAGRPASWLTSPGELARAERDDRRLTVKSIAPGYVDRARQHEPGGCALLAVVIEHLARREMPLRAAGGRAVSTLAPSSTGNI